MKRAALDEFLAKTQERAYRIAWLSVRDRDTALDMVQDAMIRLSQSYADRTADEWPPLFYRILQNRVRDWQRHQMVRNKVLFWQKKDVDNAYDPIEMAAGSEALQPDKALQSADTMTQLYDAVSELPQRQREVFLLRAIEQLNVKQTAAALKIGEGSIKTHYSRALTRLRESLGEHWP